MDDNGKGGRDRRTAMGAMLAMGVAVAGSANAAPRPARGKGGDDMAARLDALEGRAAVTEVLLAYARANDRVDEAMLRNCFWPESTHSHGRFQGRSTDFIDFALKILRGVKFTAHHISNISVEVRGDQAFSECYYFAHHRRDRKEGGGEEDALFEGRYLDRLERRDGVWKIIERRGLSDWSPAPIPASTPYAQWPAGQHSERYPNDDYFKMRQAFLAGK